MARPLISPPFAWRGSRGACQHLSQHSSQPRELPSITSKFKSIYYCSLVLGIAVLTLLVKLGITLARTSYCRPVAITSLSTHSDALQSTHRRLPAQILKQTSRILPSLLAFTYLSTPTAFSLYHDRKLPLILPTPSPPLPRISVLSIPVCSGTNLSPRVGVMQDLLLS